VGGHAKGTFTATLKAGAANPATAKQTLTVSGDFDVIRGD